MTLDRALLIGKFVVALISFIATQVIPLVAGF